MIGTRIVSLVALVAALAPTTALAQSIPMPFPAFEDIPFRELETSVLGPSQPRRAYIQSFTALRRFFDGQFVTFPQGETPPDFSKETVLAVGMGPQSSGGYEIRITKITHMAGGITGGMTFVNYVERRPAPGEMVTLALTNPVHLVRIPKLRSRFVFTKVSDQEFRKLTLEVVGGFPIPATSDLVLESNGRVRLQRTSPVALIAPVEGQATAAELAVVKDAFREARVATLPEASVSGPFTLTLTSVVQGGNVFTYGSSLSALHPRVRPLVNALRVIQDRLVSPSPSGFSEVLFIRSNSWTNTLTEIRVSADGKASLERRLLSAPSGAAPIPFMAKGQATQAEMKALEDAIAAAKVDTLPKTVGHVIMDGTSFKLQTRIGSNIFSSRGFLEGLGNYEAKVGPILAALRAIENRLSGQPMTGITGAVGQ
jgi:hypothetical protein